MPHSVLAASGPLGGFEAAPAGTWEWPSDGNLGGRGNRAFSKGNGVQRVISSITNAIGRI